MKIRRVLGSCLLLLVLSVPTFGDSFLDNWHQWRGPLANGVSPSANPPVEWSEDKNIKWKVPVDGRGISTPIIWDDRVFLSTAIDTGIKDPSIPDPKDQPKTNFFDIKRPNTEFAFVVLCLDRNTGKEMWRQTATTRIPHEGTHNDNNYASASPVTDGKYLYCWFGSAGLYCYDLNGKKIWERDLGKVKVESSLGEGCSPVLHDGRLVILRDHAGQSTIEVLDAETGQTLWKKEREERTAWATPLIVEHSGRTQIITAASSLVRSYDLESGDLIWQCSGLTGNVIPCPVVEGDHVICMSGYQGFSALAIPLTETGDITETSKLHWKKDRDTPYIPSPVLYDGLLFYLKSNQSILTCVDSTTGDVVFGPERLGQLSNVYSSPVGAGNRIYFTDRNGKTLVLNRSSKYTPVATNQLDDRIDASPAIAGNQLFLRGETYLYCIESR